MSKVSKVLGGGGSSTSQTSTNSTNVTVENQISNIIDLSIIAEALKGTAAQTQELITQLSKAQIIAQVAEVQAKVQQNELIRQGLKIAGLSGIAYLIWRHFYGK